MRLREKRTYLAVATALATVVLTLVVSACGQSSAAGQSSGVHGIATQALQNPPDGNWDPAIESEWVYAAANIYETLLRYEPSTGTFDYVLATKYEHSSNGLTWTFTIRQGVKFHDGTTLNAQAVKFSIEREIKLGQGAAYIWGPVKSIDTPNATTVVFHLNYPAPLDLIAAAPYGAYILSPTAVRSHPANWLSEGHDAGTGPYTLSSFQAGSQAVLKAFPDYWRGWNGSHFQYVVMNTVAEESSRRQLMEKGGADFTDGLSPEDVAAMEKEPTKVTIVKEQSFQNDLLALNTQKPPLNNPLVRKAISYAFPYTEACASAAGGLMTQAHGIIPRAMWGYDPSAFQYSTNLAKARQLLKQAGYPSGGFSLLMTYNSGDELEKAVGELFRSELSLLNIQLTLRQMPFETQWQLAKLNDPTKRQDIFQFYWWPTVSSPTDWFYNLLYPEHTINYNLSYWSNPRVTKLTDMASAASASSRTKAASLIDQAQNVVIQAAPYIFAGDIVYADGVSPTLAGVKLNPAYAGVVQWYFVHRK